MPKLFASAGILLASLTLAGCSAFYPNWGATSLPVEPETTVSASAEATAEPSQTPTETATAETTAEPEVTETSAPALINADVEIVMASPDTDAGVLVVVAQVLGVVETGGKCVFKFIGGSVSKTMEVSAEPSSDYTQCRPIEFPLAELPKGNGVVTVTYTSETHTGVSAGSSVVIQ